MKRAALRAAQESTRESRRTGQSALETHELLPNSRERIGQFRNAGISATYGWTLPTVDARTRYALTRHRHMYIEPKPSLILSSDKDSRANRLAFSIAIGAIYLALELEISQNDIFRGWQMVCARRTCCKSPCTNYACLIKVCCSEPGAWQRYIISLQRLYAFDRRICSVECGSLPESSRPYSHCLCVVHNAGFH